MPDPSMLETWVTEGRQRSLALVGDLSDEQVRVPWWPTINLMLWELCHASYFYEVFFLRMGLGQDPVRPDTDALFDSTTIGHETRWNLPLPDRADCLRYVDEVHERVRAAVAAELDARQSHLLQYSVFHGDMHHEALTYTRQTLGYPAPRFETAPAPTAASAHDGGAATDIEFVGGEMLLGATDRDAFCFDNEKWGHPVRVEPFAMSRTAASEGQMRAFVLDGGYERPELWSVQGWAWRQAASSGLPLYWRRDKDRADRFERRHFDRWIPIDEHRAMIHVNALEADAWCRWAGRRLPTEAEWEMAASIDGRGVKRRQPWGDEPPTGAHANLEWSMPGPGHVEAFAAGDSADGCRQLIGNVWEWTSSVFAPYPGFVPDMYADYSQVSFHTRRVLRGGCWATPRRTIRSSWRNFFQPARSDVFAGFRTCRL